MPSENDEKSVVLKKIQSLPMRSETTDVLLNIFKATLATAPCCGGIASLLSDYIPSARFQRLEKFAQQIADDLLKLSDRVNESYILTDDFAFLFERGFRGVAENYQSEKLAAFRGILINSAVRDDYSEEEKEYFLNLVNRLSALHIRMLRFLANPKDYLRDAAIPEDQITGRWTEFFPIVVPGVHLEIIESAFEDLHKYDLTVFDKSLFRSKQDTSLRAFEGGGIVSEFGKRFIQFCVSPATAFHK